MKFALVEGKKVEAYKGAKGVCPGCGKTLIARCGDQRVDHWSHKGIRNCDPWWENETEWHRAWKGNYPEEWQEFVFQDTKTGEKHIADVHTKHGLVVEFQHSHIDPKERISREKFYKNMIWVVDGTRLKNDYPRFLKGKESLFFTKTKNNNIYIVEFPDDVFPVDWLDSSVPVIFDFLGLSTDETDENRNTLWCLVPKQGGKTYVVSILRQSFIKTTLHFPTLFEPPKRPEKQKQQLIIQPKRNIHRGPLIDWIQRKQDSGKWKPRRK